MPAALFLDGPEWGAKPAPDLLGDLHAAGSSKPLKLQPGVRAGGCVFGGTRRQWRYTLSRIWDEDLPTICFIMENPSVADGDGDDRTVAKCQMFARKWGYGSLVVGNSFAYRSTSPHNLILADDPVGPDNDLWLDRMVREAACTVLACGTPPYPTLWPRLGIVRKIVTDAGKVPHVLRLSEKHGRPVHPLYLPSDLVPVAWEE